MKDQTKPGPTASVAAPTRGDDARPAPSTDALEGVLHDIRHSAATVTLLLRVLQDHRNDHAAERAATDGIADCARVITQLVDQASPIAATRLDLVLDDVADRTRLLHQGRLIVVTEPVLVLASRVDLVRIMANLLDNARDATAQDQLIAAIVTVDGSRAVTRITNPTDPAHPPLQGTGLSVVQRLVERLGGSFAVVLHDAEVEAVVELPLYAPATGRPPAEELAEQGAAP